MDTYKCIQVHTPVQIQMIIIIQVARQAMLETRGAKFDHSIMDQNNQTAFEATRLMGQGLCATVPPPILHEERIKLKPFWQ